MFVSAQMGGDVRMRERVINGRKENTTKRKERREEYLISQIEIISNLKYNDF